MKKLEIIRGCDNSDVRHILWIQRIKNVKRARYQTGVINSHWKYKRDKLLGAINGSVIIMYQTNGTNRSRFNYFPNKSGCKLHAIVYFLFQHDNHPRQRTL